jgi:hypothetical protein
MNGLKNLIIHIIFSTGAALVILALFSVIINVEISFVPTVFEILFADILIVIGLFIRWKFEIRNIILEHLVDISYILAVLIVFGLIFDWYSTIPVWLLIVMAIISYLFSMIITITRLKKEVEEINKLLKKRKENEG